MNYLPIQQRSQFFKLRFFSEAIKTDERVAWHWGSTAKQFLGSAETSITPAKIPSFTNVSAVSCGVQHSAFINNGDVYTFGSNRKCQLGVPDINESLEPVKVNIENAVAVSCGALHTCAISDDGGLHTWGYGGSFFWGAGATGHPDRDSRKNPQRIPLFDEMNEKVVQVACGHHHTLVLTESNNIYSTGRGEYGRLGRGGNGDQTEFAALEYFASIEPRPTIVKIAAGQAFSAALTQNGEVYVWGKNDFGQLGLGFESMGDVYSSEIYPRIVRSLSVQGIRIIDIACGDSHMTALSDGGFVYIWGARDWLEPHNVVLPSYSENSIIKGDLWRVAAGHNFSSILDVDGNVYIWGKKSSKCLIVQNPPNSCHIQPFQVPNTEFDNKKVLEIAFGRSRCMAITEN
eukprot:GHVL01024038.1.p1 GENE.GHVL01024038.1~~GHVL01024038.1.p1  ORF type:complete len:402 (+),score=65.73 GHVL01024038.1:58-1263(+)